LFRLLSWAGPVLGIGLAYALFVRRTGLAVPCLFHAVTGLLCPGCGVTRMCVALLTLDFEGAWRANPGLLLMAPALAALLGSMAWRYVRRGEKKLLPWQNALVWCMVGFLLVYGGARNLPQFAALAPR